MTGRDQRPRLGTTPLWSAAAKERSCWSGWVPPSLIVPDPAALNGVPLTGPASSEWMPGCAARSTTDRLSGSRLDNGASTSGRPFLVDGVAAGSATKVRAGLLAGLAAGVINANGDATRAMANAMLLGCMMPSFGDTTRVTHFAMQHRWCSEVAAGWLPRQSLGRAIQQAATWPQQRNNAVVTRRHRGVERALLLQRIAVVSSLAALPMHP